MIYLVTPEIDYSLQNSRRKRMGTTQEQLALARLGQESIIMFLKSGLIAMASQL